MQIQTVDHIKTLPNKMPVTAIQGTFKRIMKAENGPMIQDKQTGEEYYEYQKQGIEFEDSTGTIWITNWSAPLPTSDEGEVFLVESIEGKKGPTGLSVNIWNDKVKLNMSEHAKIRPVGASGQPETPQQPATIGQQPLVRPPQQPPNRPPQTPVPAPGAPPAIDPEQIGRRAAQGCLIATQLALEIAQTIRQQYAEVVGDTPDQAQIASWASSIQYYMRDQGAFKHLEPLRSLQPLPPEAQEKLKEILASPLADEDEIPF